MRFEDNLTINGRDTQFATEFKVGDSIKISNEENGENIIPVSNGVRFQAVNPGAKILINDGKIVHVTFYQLCDTGGGCFL